MPPGELFLRNRKKKLKLLQNYKHFLTSQIMLLIPKGPKQPLSGVIIEGSTSFTHVFVGRVGSTATLGVHEELVPSDQPATQATCDESCGPENVNITVTACHSTQKHYSK